MRSEEINPLFTSISSISGIGPKIEQLFNKLLGNKLINLLLHIPYNVIKRKNLENLLEAPLKTNITIKVKIIKHIPSIFKRQPYKVKCFCGDIPLDLVFFNARHPVIKKNLPLDSERLISGKIENFRNNYQITHPTHINEVNKFNNIKEIEPVYGLTAGLNQKIIQKAINHALKFIPDLEEWIDKDIVNKYSFISWKKTLIKIHNPISSENLTNINHYRRRLAYDELLAHQLSLYIIRRNNIKKKGLQLAKINRLEIKFLNSLPFELTDSQKKSWDEIKKDLESENQMIRLLQGDVGCGKTILAILAAIKTINSGYQAAIMVPTSILAQQHFSNIFKLLSDFNITIEILTSKDKGKKRIEKLENIRNGKINFVVGTHSLVQDDVRFNSIGLVIVDEQHRFGVFQRMAFTNKGHQPSILVMSATPIPRTLALAVYGDMDESRITEKPHGRLPIITKNLLLSKEKILINRLKNKLKKNEKAYWICPLIEESEEIDLKAAKERYINLKKIFDKKVLLLHGQMKENEKEEIMNKFKNEDFKILVSTTVIEVGIDIAEATTIIIEHAERFGLAQLHQLRGRVGRNKIQSNCILLHKENIGDNAKKRLKKMQETNDGFIIAEKDLEIRGPGEMLGKKQSGLPSFKIADLSFDKDLLEDARNQVDKLFIEKKKLKNVEREKIKNLLYIYERDIALKTLQAG